MPAAKSSRRKRIRTGDLFLVVLFGAVAVLVYNYSLSELIGVLYNPVAGLVVVLLIAQFLWLKSGDRTRVYRLEVERLRDSRRRDEGLMRRAADLLSEAEEGDANKEPWRERSSALRRELEERL